MAHVLPVPSTVSSLRKHLVLYVFLPIAAVTTVLVWTAYVTVENLVETRLEREIELVARSLRMPVEGALREGDPRRLGEALGAVSEIGRVYGAIVYDAQGRRIAVAGDAMPGPAEQIQAAELVALGEERGGYASVAGEAVYSYFVPLSTRLGRIDGLLQVVREESDIELRLARIRVIGTATLIGTLAVMLLVLILGHRLALMKPVERLLTDMRRVERGDRSWRASVGSPRELAQLASGVNHMLDALDQAELEVAERRRAEIRLNKRIQQQEREAALGRFSASVAHELGAPLSVIQGDVRRLAPLIVDDDGKRRLERIREQLKRTRRLIAQLMGLVREQPARPEPVDLAQVIERAVDGARPEAETSGISIELDPIESRSIESRPVEGVAIRIEHAVLNLVRNAVQAARGRIAVSLSVNETGVSVVVEDDGPGVSPDRRETIFEPFASQRGDGSGTGLGLSIVQSAAEVHGGDVVVGQSDRLGGGRFELRIPRGAAP